MTIWLLTIVAANIVGDKIEIYAQSVATKTAEKCLNLKNAGESRYNNKFKFFYSTCEKSSIKK